MRIKHGYLAAFGVFLVLISGLARGAVDTRDIDAVRDKTVLQSSDLQIIDDFVNQAILQLVRSKDFTSIARDRAVILSRKHNSGSNDQQQYCEQFAKSASKYIRQSFDDAEQMDDAERKFRVKLNLLILVDGLADIRLANLAVDKLNDENKAIRYWAVHSITSLGILEQLNSGGADELKLALNVVKQLDGMIEEFEPEELALVITFAAGLDLQNGRELFMRIVDMRLTKYSNWTVENELLDTTILRLLYAKLSAAGAQRNQIASRFGQLFSYVMERYINGQDVLSDKQKSNLASVMAEVEQSFMRMPPLSMPQRTIRQAVGNGDVAALSQDHLKLFGDGTTAGALSLKLDIDYGQGSGGTKKVVPFSLRQPSKISK